MTILEKLSGSDTEIAIAAILALAAVLTIIDLFRCKEWGEGIRSEVIRFALLTWTYFLAIAISLLLKQEGPELGFTVLALGAIVFPVGLTFGKDQLSLVPYVLYFVVVAFSTMTRNKVRFLAWYMAFICLLIGNIAGCVNRSYWI